MRHLARTRVRAPSCRRRPCATGLAFWAFFARRPWLYGFATDLAARALAFVGRAHGRFRWLPLAGGWTDQRDFPAPQGATFQAQWRTAAGERARRSCLHRSAAALGVNGREAPRREAVADRLREHPAGVVPRRGHLRRRQNASRCLPTWSTAAAGSVTRVSAAADIPSSVAEFLRRHNLPLTVRRGDDARLTAMPVGARAIARTNGRTVRRTPTRVACRMPSAPWPRPERWCSRPARTIRRR